MFHNWLDSFNDFFNIDNKTTVPVFITLLVFLLTQLLTGLSNSFKASRKRKAIKRIIKKNLLEFAISLKKETNNSFIASEIFKSRINSNFKIVKSSFPQLSVFTEIGYKELFNTFYKGIFNWFNTFLKIRAVSKLWAVVNDVKEWEEYTKTQLDKFNELNNEQIRLFNKSHGDYIDYTYHLLISNFSTENEKNYVIELGQIHEKWLNIDNHIDQDIVYEQLVKPSDELNKKHVKLTPHLTLQSLRLLQEMDLNYRNRKQLLNSYSSIYAISNNFFLMNLRRIEVIDSILYPSLKLSLKRIFHFGKTKKHKKSAINPQFLPEPI